jgi:hypothetical protein
LHQTLQLLFTGLPNIVLQPSDRWFHVSSRVSRPHAFKDFLQTSWTGSGIYQIGLLLVLRAQGGQGWGMDGCFTIRARSPRPVQSIRGLLFMRYPLLQRWTLRRISRPAPCGKAWCPIACLVRTSPYVTLTSPLRKSTNDMVDEMGSEMLRTVQSFSPSNAPLLL